MEQLSSDHKPEQDLNSIFNAADNSNGTLETRKRKFETLPLGPIEPYERVEFDSLSNRATSIQEVVKAYRDHPRINELLNTVKIPEDTDYDGLTKREESDVLEALPEYRLLNHQEVVQLYSRIEYGLSVSRGLDGKSPSEDQEKALVELAAAYSIVMSCNIGLAAKRALRFGFKRTDPVFHDLLQHSIIGLDSGVKRFQYWQGYRLSTYVIDWIDQSLKRGFAETTRTVWLPIYKDDQWSNYRDAVVHLAQEYQREPTTDEIAEQINLTPQQIIELEIYGPAFSPSLNAPITNEADGGELIDLIPGQSDIDPQPEPAFSPERHLLIEEVLKTADVPYRSQLMLSLKYGVYLPRFEGKTFGHNGGSFAYGELIEALHTNERVLTDEDIANLLGIKEQTVIDRVSKTIGKISKHPEIQKIDPSR